MNNGFHVDSVFPPVLFHLLISFCLMLSSQCILLAMASLCIVRFVIVFLIILNATVIMTFIEQVC